MRRVFSARMSVGILVIAFIFLFGGSLARSEGRPVRRFFRNVASDRSVPDVFASVLPKVKAKTHVPILLPSELPEPIRKAKNAVVGKVTAGKYTISVYYQLGIGDAGFAALFAAEAKPRYNPRELPNVHAVRLARGIEGFFRAVSCGGSCAPANLWWEQRGILYQIQLKLSSTLSERAQEESIAAVADSSILAGPR